VVFLIVLVFVGELSAFRFSKFVFMAIENINELFIYGLKTVILVVAL
jgi:hypothetical protein